MMQSYVAEKVTVSPLTIGVAGFAFVWSFVSATVPYDPVFCVAPAGPANSSSVIVALTSGQRRRPVAFMGGPLWQRDRTGMPSVAAATLPRASLLQHRAGRARR